MGQKVKKKVKQLTMAGQVIIKRVKQAQRARPLVWPFHATKSKVLK